MSGLEEMGKAFAEQAIVQLEDTLVRLRTDRERIWPFLQVLGEAGGDIEKIWGRWVEVEEKLRRLQNYLKYGLGKDVE